MACAARIACLSARSAACIAIMYCRRTASTRVRCSIDPGDTVRKRLWDAATPAKGEYLAGSEKQGWILTATGLKFATKNIASVGSADLSKERLGLKEKQWLRSERVRMMSSEAYAKTQSGQTDAVTVQEAEEFFRIDAYVTGQAREQKIMRALTAFGDDPELSEAVKILARKVRAGGKQ